MAAARDIVIIGGGHNALVTAFYLARKGHKPLVVERRVIVGGAAVTEEFHPGFRCSALAHAAGPILPAIAKDMDLARHGLHAAEPAVRLFAPSPDGRALRSTTLRNITASSRRSIAPPESSAACNRSRRPTSASLRATMSGNSLSSAAESEASAKKK
jgi:phytoene dehydrogenase-like protein